MENTDLTYLRIVIMGSLAMLMLTTGIAVFIYLFQRKLIKRKIAYQEIADLLRKQELKSTYAMLEGQEMERKRIAEELHDNLGSILVTLSMYSDTLLTAKDKEHPEIITKIRALAANASEETRRLSHSLHSGLLQHFGLQTALHDLMDAVKTSTNISIDMHLDATTSLPQVTAMNIYRIVQELVQNTLKHARASRIRLEVTAIPGEYISVIYEDNGRGFPAEQLNSKGIGLVNINARAERLNGQLSIQSLPNQGTTVILEIPLTHENESSFSR